MTEARPASDVGESLAGGRGEGAGGPEVCSAFPPVEWSATWRGAPSGPASGDRADPWAGEERPSDSWPGSWPGAPHGP